MQEKLHLCQL